jgi:hypothetical protein
MRFRLPALNGVAGTRFALGGVVRERARHRGAPCSRRTLQQGDPGADPPLGSPRAAAEATLPGAMTSQVLAGTDPLEAAEYQILPIFLLWAAVASPPSLWFTLRQCG